jgi:hypothetical protein
MKLVPESLNDISFRRGVDPLDAMDIGDKSERRRREIVQREISQAESDESSYGLPYRVIHRDSSPEEFRRIRELLLSYKHAHYDEDEIDTLLEAIKLGIVAALSVSYTTERRDELNYYYFYTIENHGVYDTGDLEVILPDLEEEIDKRKNPKR